MTVVVPSMLATTRAISGPAISDSMLRIVITDLSVRVKLPCPASNPSFRLLLPAGTAGSADTAQGPLVPVRRGADGRCAFA